MFCAPFYTMEKSEGRYKNNSALTFHLDRGIPASYLEWITCRALALHVCNHATKLAPGWSRRSISRMTMIKYLLKVFRC